MNIIPNSKVFGNVLTCLKNEAIIDNVVIVRIIIISFVLPDINIDKPAPINKNNTDSNKANINFENVRQLNIPL